jgi:hypothetical protein
MSKALERPQYLTQKQPKQVYKSPEQKAKGTFRLKRREQKLILRVKGQKIAKNA